MLMQCLVFGLAPAAPQALQRYDILGFECSQVVDDYEVCFVAPAAPPSPESFEDDRARVEGTTGIPHRHIKVTYLGLQQLLNLDVDAMFGVWFGSSSSSGSSCV